MANRWRVVVVGQGYMGLPLAMRAVEAGHDVVGFEIYESRTKRIELGESVALRLQRELPGPGPAATGSDRLRRTGGARGTGVQENFERAYDIALQVRPSMRRSASWPAPREPTWRSHRSS
jgi:nucleoside-diphosphate-sugar epimerase